MFAALILAISIVALLQFALYYWRAILAGALAQPVSEEVRTAACIDRAVITGKDFAALAGIHHTIPGGSGGLGFVPLYYRMVDAVGALAMRIPVIAAWTESETAICAHYVGVQIDRRMQANRELAASANS
jgi:hypothetical protein